MTSRPCKIFKPACFIQWPKVLKWLDKIKVVHTYLLPLLVLDSREVTFEIGYLFYVYQRLWPAISTFEYFLQLKVWQWYCKSRRLFWEIFDFIEKSSDIMWRPQIFESIFHLFLTSLNNVQNYRACVRNMWVQKKMSQRSMGLCTRAIHIPWKNGRLIQVLWPSHNIWTLWWNKKNSCITQAIFGYYNLTSKRI